MLEKVGNLESIRVGNLRSGIEEVKREFTQFGIEQ